MSRETALAEIILKSDKLPTLIGACENLARAADTAELLLRRDFPGEAASLRDHVARAKYLLAEMKPERTCAD